MIHPSEAGFRVTIHVCRDHDPYVSESFLTIRVESFTEGIIRGEQELCFHPGADWYRVRLLDEQGTVIREVRQYKDGIREARRSVTA